MATPGPAPATTRVVPDPPPPPGPHGWLCCICAVVVGGRAVPARTLVGGDAVCLDHVRLRADCASLGLAIREARADLGR